MSIKSLLLYCALLTYVSCQKLRYSNYLGLQKATRNDFVLKNVTIDEKNSINVSVNFWKSFNGRYISYAIGFGDDNIVALKATTVNRTDVKFDKVLLDTPSAYNDAALVEIKNFGVIVVAIKNSGNIDWLFAENLETVWNEKLGYQVEHVKIGYNSVLRRRQIFVSTKNDIYIYNFDFGQKKLWWVQKIKSDAIGSFDVAVHHSNLYLLVPNMSADKLSIFKFRRDAFEEHATLNTPQINTVVTFHENFQTFFAIDGLDAGIYRFGKRSKIFREHTSDGMTYWLPVKITNFPHETILFGQRLLNHDSHKSLVTDIFVYNDDHFEEHEDIPCIIYGEQLNTFNCLSIEDNNLGIKGAGYLSLGKTLKLLLPKKSSIYDISYEEIVSQDPIQTEIRLLNETKRKLQAILTKPRVTEIRASKPSDLRTKAAFIENTKEEMNQSNRQMISETVNAMLIELGSIKARIDKVQRQLDTGKFKKLIIDGTATINVLNTTKVIAKSLDPVIEDITRKDQTAPIEGVKQFKNLQVDNISFETINNVSAFSLVFLNDSMTLNGDITVQKQSSVTKNLKFDFINDEPSSSLVDMSRPIKGDLKLETLQLNEVDAEEINGFSLDDEILADGNQTTFIPYNITVKRVNGDNFDDVIRELCLVNIETSLPRFITIFGNVTVLKPSHAYYVNNLEFPGEYLSLDGTDGVAVTGEKIFEGTLSGEQVKTTNETINGLNTGEFITTSTAQTIPGKIIFDDLEVTGPFTHDGGVIGNLTTFLPNPTMLNEHLIKSNAHFQDLEVTGAIILKGHLNGDSFVETLEDIIYKNDVNPVINSIKEFPQGLTILQNLNITSNCINLIPIDQIVTKDTTQTLEIIQLNGDVSITTMHIKELINGTNITKLDQEIVRTFGTQFIPSALIFEEKLEAANLEIEEKLNDTPVENFLSITENRFIEGDVTFDELITENLTILGDFTGNITEFYLESLIDSKLTYDSVQNISEEFIVENSKISDLLCENIGEQKCDGIFNKEKLKENVMEKINRGDIVIDELIVNGELTINRMENISLNENQDYRNTKSLTIRGNVLIPSVRINKLSSVDFDRFLRSVIYKNQTNIEVGGIKTFVNGLIVMQMVEVDNLNGIPVKNLLTKEDQQNISSSLVIEGNVTFNGNVHVIEFNNMRMKELENYCEYQDEIYLIRGDLLFDRHSHIYSLVPLLNLNGLNVKETFENMAYKTATSAFAEDIQFENKVTIFGDLDINKQLNDMDLSEVADNIIYLDDTKGNTVNSPVTFSSKVITAHKVQVEESLWTKTFCGKDLASVLEDAVFLDRGRLTGTFNFANVEINDKLVTEYINDIYMNATVSLIKDEDLDELEVENAQFLANTQVTNFVNGYVLDEEYANTVLSDVEQIINSTIHFHNSTLIRNNLTVSGLLNDHPISKIVTTNTDQNLTGRYNFESETTVDSDMIVTNLVNSIKIDEWNNNSVKTSSNETQEIEATWHVMGNLIFDDTLDGNNSIQNFDLPNELDDMIKEKEIKEKVMEQIEDNYENACKTVKFLTKMSAKQIFKFERFEDLQEINYPSPIRKAFFFQNNEDVLLLNGENSCTTQMYFFQNNIFVSGPQLEIGAFEQIITALNKGTTYLVVRVPSNTTCGYEGTRVWKYENRTMKQLAKLNNQQVLQESLVPATFYGLGKLIVTEFRIDYTKAIPVEAYRKWNIDEDTITFIPRGLGSGLAVTNTEKLIYLSRDDTVDHNDVGFDKTLLGKTMQLKNLAIPLNGETLYAVSKVGPKNQKRSLLAVAYREESIVSNDLNFVRIYEDFPRNQLFQTIITHNPTSLLSLDFGNGETLLLIIEDKKILNIYEYKGIEGFKRRSTTELPGQQMFKMNIKSVGGGHPEVIALVNGHQLKIIRSIMIGNFVDEEVDC